MYLLARFILQNFKKILGANPELWGCVIFGPQMVHLPQFFFFFFEKINNIFIYLLAPFILQNLKKKFLEPIQSYEDVPFLGQKYPNWSWTKFFGTDHYYYFHLPIGPFHWAKFKKNSYSRSRVMMPHFWAPNGPFAPNDYFSQIINITFI